MVAPRRSARVKAQDSTPVYTDPPAPGKGTKRKSDLTGPSPNAKRGRKSSKKDDEKEQPPADEAMDVDENDDDDPDNDDPNAEEDGEDASDAKTQPRARDIAPAEKSAEDVKVSEDSQINSDEKIKEQEKAVQDQKLDAQSDQQPEQSNRQSGADQANTAPTKEPEQANLDGFVQKLDEAEPAKASDNAPVASGALQPNSNEEASGASKYDSKPEHLGDSKPAQPSTQSEAPQTGSDGSHSKGPNTHTETPQAEQKHNQPEQEAPSPGAPRTEEKDGRPEQQMQHTEDPQTEKREPPPSLADYQQPNGQSGAKSAEETTEEKLDESAPKSTNGNAVEAQARDDDVPSSILEKGIVYFFFRSRVNIGDAHDVNDIARSYMILRPLPRGAKLNDGPIGDESNCRLIAIPKKVLPLSGKDRFMVFVESAKKSFKDLKTSFLSASDYATKTQGTSHTPSATPIAEGVYAITTTGRESHFAYMTTLPHTLGEVQKDVGIKDQGSFVVSAKSPKHPGPANATLQRQPDYPQNILDEFRDLRWMPLKPELLDYENTQFLLIGESGGIDSALEQLPRDEKKGFDEPKEEMERLEGEDELRVKHLKGDDAVFADLGVSKKEYPALLTTWES